MPERTLFGFRYADPFLSPFAVSLPCFPRTAPVFHPRPVGMLDMIDQDNTPGERERNTMTMTDVHNSRIPGPTWEGLLKSCGLRRAELECLRVSTITQDDTGQIWLHVAESEESPARDVPVFDGFSWAIADILAQHYPNSLEDAVPFQEALKRRSPDELLVSSVPADLDFEKGRREYAWWTYFGAIEALDVIRSPKTFHEAGERVRLALGLPKVNATIRSFMRQAKRAFMREFGV